MSKPYRLQALLHPTVVGDGFVIPLFFDQRVQDMVNFVQTIMADRVHSLKPIDINQLDEIIRVNDQIEIEIGDKGIFAFKSKSFGAIVGNSDHVKNQLKLIIGDYAEKPRLLSSIEGFIDEHSNPADAVNTLWQDQEPSRKFPDQRQEGLETGSSFSSNPVSYPSNALNRIGSSATLDMTARVEELRAQGIDVIGLAAGEPDSDTPKFVKDAAIAAIRHGHTRYTNVDGTNALKDAICNKFKRDNKLDYSLDQISVNVGSKHTLFNALVATLYPGDEVIIPAPYWLSYPNIVRFAEGTPIFISAGAAQNYKIAPAQLEAAITPRTKWLILNSPSNPTGAAYSTAELRALGEVIERHPHVWVMSNDMYEHIIYDDFEFTTIAQVCPALYERTLTINGCSKVYSMTGWRIGYAGGAPWLIKAMAKLQSQSTSNPSSIAQAAATAALNGNQSFLKARKKVLQRRRNLVVSMLNQIDGMTCPRPEGAFYVYPEFSGLIGKTTPEGQVITSDELMIDYLLNKAYVAVVPGAAFGFSPAMRISYTTSDSILKEACERIQQACAVLTK